MPIPVMDLAKMMVAMSRTPRHWEAANDVTKPPRKASKDRSKVKAARRQNRGKRK